MKSDTAQKLAGMVLEYLEKSGQTELLPEVIAVLSARSVRLGLENSAIVTTPAKLDASEMKAIASYIKSKYGKTLNVIERIDPSLIAGFTIKIGDEVIDSSLAAKLENIRKELV